MQTDARISVITGLTRKDVARLKGTAAPDDSAAVEQYHRAARVIGGWLRDARFLNKAGRPAALAFDGNVASFSELVKSYSGDIPPRAMLDELLRVGTVERGKNGTLRLVTAGYVPKGSSTDQLHILGSDVALLIGTIDHNLTPDQREPYFQRKVAYDNLPVEALAPLRAMTEEKAQALLEEINRYLAKHDRDTNPAAQGSGRKHAGVGNFYFERDVDEEKRYDRPTCEVIYAGARAACGPRSLHRRRHANGGRRHRRHRRESRPHHRLPQHLRQRCRIRHEQRHYLARRRDRHAE